MQIILERCAALGVHKKSITACVRTPDGANGRAERVRTFPTFHDGRLELRAWLTAQGVTHVAMESTSSYWLPAWRVLENDDSAFRPLLAGARHVKRLPGRKTDVAWLCQPPECRLPRPSFVPRRRSAGRAQPRWRKRLVGQRTTEAQRVESALEDAIVEIGAVASQTLTKFRTSDDRGADRRRA